MDSHQLETITGPLSLNVSYSVRDAAAAEEATEGLPAAGDDVPNDGILVGQKARDTYIARDPAEFELLIALRIRHARWIFEIPHRNIPRATHLLVSIRQRLPTIELPLQYSTVEAVTLFIAAASVFTLYSLLDSQSLIFQAKQEDFVPFKYIGRSNAGADIQPYIDGLRPYAATSLRILGPLLSLVISQSWLINTAQLANTALKGNNSTRFALREGGSHDIAGTVGELLVKIVRVWLRAD